MKQKWLIFGFVFLFVLLFVNFLDARVVYESEEILGQKISQSPIWSINYLKNPKDLFEFSFSWVQYHFNNILGFSRFNDLVSALNLRAGEEIYSLGGFTFFSVFLFISIFSIVLIFSLSSKEIGKKILYSSFVLVFFIGLLFLFNLWSYVTFLSYFLFSKKMFRDSIFVLLVWVFVILYYFFSSRVSINTISPNSSFFTPPPFTPPINPIFSSQGTLKNLFSWKYKLHFALKSSWFRCLVFTLLFFMLIIIPFTSGPVDLITFGRGLTGWRILLRSFIFSIILVAFPEIWKWIKTQMSQERFFEKELKETAKERIKEYQTGIS